MLIYFSLLIVISVASSEGGTESRSEIRDVYCIGNMINYLLFIPISWKKKLNTVNTDKLVGKSSNQILRATTGLWMVWSRVWSSISYSFLTAIVDQIRSLFRIFFELWEFKILIITLLLSGSVFIGISISERINSAIVKNRFCSLLKDKHEQRQVKRFGNFPTEKAPWWKLNVL